MWWAKTWLDVEWACYWNKTGGTEKQIKAKNYNFTAVFQNVLVNSSYNTVKSMNGIDEVVFRDLLHTIDSFFSASTKRHVSSRDKIIKYGLDIDSTKFLDWEIKYTTSQSSKLKGKRLEIFFIRFNIIDIYTKLKTFLILELFYHIITSKS